MSIFYRDDYDHSEITGIIIKPSLFYAQDNAVSTEDEQQLINELSNLSFCSVENMARYFLEYSPGDKNLDI